MPHWDWVCQEKINFLILSWWSRAAPTQQRHCRAKTLSLSLLLTLCFCFTYPLPDCKKSSGIQKLPQISCFFFSGLLILDFFTKALLRIVIWNLAYCKDVSKKPIPLGRHCCISKWLSLPSGSLYQQLCLVVCYIKQKLLPDICPAVIVFSFLPCTTQSSVSPFENI